MSVAIATEPITKPEGIAIKKYMGSLLVCVCCLASVVFAQRTIDIEKSRIAHNGLFFGSVSSAGGIPQVAMTDSFAFIQVYGARVNNQYWSNAFYGSTSQLSIALGDLDRDGDLDLVRGSRYRLEWIKNIGTIVTPEWERLNWGNIVPDDNEFWTPTLVDIDADGDLDLFCGTLYGSISFWPNIGDSLNPIWGIQQSDFAGISVSRFAHPSFCDIDADGDKDLFVGNDSGAIYFYRNTGFPQTPSFQIQTSSYVNTVTIDDAAPSFVDIDNDGDYDLMIGRGYGTILFFRNTGTAQDASWNLESFQYAGISLGYGYLKCSFADIDGDSDKDMFITDLNGFFYFYRNDRTPSIPEWNLQNFYFDYTLNFGRPSALAVGDIDADGDNDILVGTHIISLLKNIGTAQTPSWEWNGDQPVSLNDFWVVPELADIDADGDLDLFVGTVGGQLNFYRNIGNPSSAQWSLITSNYAGISFASNSHVSATFADIDADSDLDMFVEHFGSGGDSLMFFRNIGSPTQSQWQLIDSNYLNISTRGIAFTNCDFADLDNDGDYDCVFGNGGGRRSFYFFKNVGTPESPSFAYEGELSGGIGVEGSSSYSAPRLADLNNDGYLDLFSGLDGGGLNFWWNNTGGTVGVTEDRHLQPVDFFLMQNYPNPFNPKTTIRYELPISSYVVLTIYNLLGQILSLLVDEHQAAGLHQATFDSINLSSGVYFYRLQAGTYVETKKLVLLR